MNRLEPDNFILEISQEETAPKNSSSIIQNIAAAAGRALSSLVSWLASSVKGAWTYLRRDKDPDLRGDKDPDLRGDKDPDLRGDKDSEESSSFTDEGELIPIYQIELRQNPLLLTESNLQSHNSEAKPFIHDFFIPKLNNGTPTLYI